MGHQITIEVEDSRPHGIIKPKTSAYEQSLEDVKNGNVNSYASAEDFFNKMGI